MMRMGSVKLSATTQERPFRVPSPFASASEADRTSGVNEIDFLAMLQNHDDLSAGQLGCHGPSLVHQIVPRGATHNPCGVARTDRCLRVAVSQESENCSGQSIPLASKGWVPPRISPLTEGDLGVVHPWSRRRRIHTNAPTSSHEFRDQFGPHTNLECLGPQLSISGPQSEDTDRRWSVRPWSPTPLYCA